MTLTIELTPEQEAQLQEAARHAGVDADQYARQIIARALPNPKGIALAQLMRQWIEEDKTDDPAELVRREAEWQEFAQNINANHSSHRVIYPEVTTRTDRPNITRKFKL